MATVPNTTTQRNPKAAYAFLDDVHGIALCDHANHVHFQATATGLSQTLTNADLPRLNVLGRLDLIATQQLVDERFGSLLALAEATTTFVDGRTFSETADATPENVQFAVKPHFARLALTRAKARCLCAVKAA